MRTRMIIAAFVLLVVVGAYGEFGGLLRRGDETAGRARAVAAENVERGGVLGAFDEGMSGVCRFACAASQPFAPHDLAIQPGVANGALTQCPVSGVVFVVDGQRPRVTIATGDYVLCCDGCTGKFRREPGRFVSL